MLYYPMGDECVHNVHKTLWDGGARSSYHCRTPVIGSILATGDMSFRTSAVESIARRAATSRDTLMETRSCEIDERKCLDASIPLIPATCHSEECSRGNCQNQEGLHG